MKYGVIGGGPAGCWLARALAQAGREVTLWEFRNDYEKPCGGGLPEKVWRQFPELHASLGAVNAIRTLQFIAPHHQEASVKLVNPLRIIARRELQRVLIRETETSGCVFRNAKVIGIEPEESGWRIIDATGSHKTDYVIFAAGAADILVKPFIGKWSPKSYVDTLVSYLPGPSRDFATIKFFPDMAGYIWEFPRLDAISVGIGFDPKTYSLSAASRRLRDWSLYRFGARGQSASLFGGRIPALEPNDWRRLQPSGDRWAAIGDAGMMSDPLTGEGLYYAFASAALLARCLLREQPTLYAHEWRRDLGPELLKAAALRPRFYQSVLLDALVRSLKSSMTLQHVVGDILDGETAYTGLRGSLVKVMARVVCETACHDWSLPVKQLQAIARFYTR